MKKNKVYRVLRKFLNKINLFSFNENRFLLSLFKEKAVYNYLVVPESCFKSKSREVILR